MWDLKRTKDGADGRGSYESATDTHCRTTHYEPWQIKTGQRTAQPPHIRDAQTYSLSSRPDMAILSPRGPRRHPPAMHLPLSAVVIIDPSMLSPAFPRPSRYSVYTRSPDRAFSRRRRIRPRWSTTKSHSPSCASKPVRKQPPASQEVAKHHQVRTNSL